MNNPTNYDITISRETLTFLQEADNDTNSNRFSKYDAYVYLAESAAEAEHDSESHLYPGEFATTYADLAEVWNWQRNNVRLFLDSLEELGAIAMAHDDKSIVVAMPFACEEDAEADDLFSAEEREFLSFLCGIAAVNELARERCV
jgi:hypothetical protein